ncbi:MAG: alpha/beta hydrolase fold domain-containing protein [Candidatus Methylacidiphilales bacterium]|nr:alpha/beta hydrolase [Candidatus Methylacidiphilales bacterium]
MKLHHLLLALIISCLALPSTACRAQYVMPKDVRITKNVPYVKGGTARQTMDVYANPKAKALLVWVHGGSWTQGNKDNPAILPLLSNGFSIVSINYRYATTDAFPAQILDCKSAIRYLRANAEALNLSTNNIGVAGQSAGGHLCALLGTTGGVAAYDVGDNPEQSSRVQAVVVMSGPTDFSLFRVSKEGDALTLLLGGLIQASPEKAKAASPLSYVAAGAPPFLLLYGERDPLISPTHGERLEAALKTFNVPVELVRFKAEHQLPARSVGPLVTKFFTKNLLD